MPRLLFFRGSILIFHWASLSIPPTTGFSSSLSLISPLSMSKEIYTDLVRGLDRKVFGSRSLCPDEGRKFSHLAGPNSVNRHFIVMTVIAAFALFGTHFLAVLYVFSWPYWPDENGPHTGCFFMFFQQNCAWGHTVACSRLSDSAEDAKVKGMLKGGRGGKKEKERKREPIIISFTILWLPPAFGMFEISAVKHLKCQWIGFFLKFLMRVFQVGLIPSDCKKGVARQHTTITLFQVVPVPVNVFFGQ